MPRQHLGDGAGFENGPRGKIPPMSKCQETSALVSCPDCRSKLSLAEAEFNFWARCPACGAFFRTPNLPTPIRVQELPGKPNLEARRSKAPFWIGAAVLLVLIVAVVVALYRPSSSTTGDPIQVTRIPKVSGAFGNFDREVNDAAEHAKVRTAEESGKDLPSSAPAEPHAAGSDRKLETVRSDAAGDDASSPEEFGSGLNTSVPRFVRRPPFTGVENVPMARLERDPIFSEALGTGLSQFWARNYQESIKYLERAQLIEPGDAVPVYFLALAHARLGHNELASSHLEAAAALEVTAPNGRLGALLERIQGRERMWLESARLKSRKTSPSPTRDEQRSEN